MAGKDGNNNINSDAGKYFENKILSLKGCKEWLEQQLLDYEAELNSMRNIEVEELKSDGKSEPNVEGLYKSISLLEKELLQVSSTHSYKCYMLERLHLCYVKMRKLFSTDGETEESSLNEEEFASHDCEELLRLSRDIVKYQQALDEEQVTLSDLRKQTREAGEVNENLKAELEDIQAKKLPSKTDKESKAESSLRKQILERQNMVKVAKNIFQALIFGSGVDWKQDEELREMVLSFGQPVNLLDT